VTEEVWRWWQPGSVHRSPWPRLSELGDHDGADPSVLTTVAGVLGHIRRAKTTQKRSMRARVRLLTVSGPAPVLAAVDAASGDLTDAGGVEALRLVEAEELSVSVELADES
jgi:valyl-tRNA synthetase